MTVGHNRPPMPAGWIAIHRTVRHHHIVGFGKPVKPCDPSRGSYSRSEAWQDLLMECRYQDGTVLNGGREMEIRRGELVGAISWLASRWNWTPKTVRGFIDALEADGAISVRAPGAIQGQQKGKQAHVISVCNYDKYQSAPDEDGQAKGHDLGTQKASNGQATGNILIRDNKDNNIPPKMADDRTQAEKDEANRIAREAYEAGLRIKGEATAKSARPEFKARGGLDGSQGLLLDGHGRLKFVNGVGQQIADALLADFPGISLDAVCNRAAAEIVKTGFVDAFQAKVILRRHAQFVMEDGHKRQTPKQTENGTERRRRLLAQIDAEEGKR